MTYHVLRIAQCLALLTILLSCAQSPAADSTAVRKQFARPPREFSSAPLWVWNDLLTEQQLTQTLEDLAGQRVKQVFVHPRPGLMTPYLSDDWFRLWRHALAEAERLDMNVWIYDENSYPSGFAGGLVPEAMPASRGLGLVVQEAADVPRSLDGVLAVYRQQEEAYVNVTETIQSGGAAPSGKYLIARMQLAPERAWHGGKYYVDLLRPGVTEKFLEITMHAYQREVGAAFGKRLPGVFTDEPHLAPAGGLHWSEHLPELFQQRWGYDLLEHLPSLVKPVGNWRRVRHNYYQLLLEQFISCWAKPCHDYCAEHGLEFTGHYWEHGWPSAGHGGDNMAMYAWHQRPAIDILMNQYSEDVNAQFGNVRVVLELSSVANQLGLRRTLCEVYGAGGWDLRFEDMKRIGDWMYVLGVNTMDEHLSYITIRGARKRDHPQSFSYHEPWWDAYHVMAEYFTRLSLVMSSGQQVNHALLLEPTTTTWMYQSEQHLATIGNDFQSLVTELAQGQVEFDLGCEDILARHGSADGPWLKVGKRQYDIVVLPPHTENLNAPTLRLLNRFLQGGGKLLCCGPPPSRVNGDTARRIARLASHAGFQQIEPGQLRDELLGRSSPDFSLKQDPGDEGILYHHRRQLDDGQFLLLVNTRIDAPCAGEIQSRARGLQQWNPQTGEIVSYPFQKTDGGLCSQFSLPACGSLLLFLSEKPLPLAEHVEMRRATLAPLAAMSVRREEPNVLTLDYVDVSVGGAAQEGIYFYKASQFVFEKHGLARNPWDSAVQLRDELIRHEFPAESGFTATYRFTIRDAVPGALSVVVERPDLYTITCNGRPLATQPGVWWLDRSFGRLDIRDLARVGSNSLSLQASPMTMFHELEPAYVLGEFALEPAESGFVIVADRGITLSSPSADRESDDGSRLPDEPMGWDRQGHPFYAAAVAYRQEFDVPRPQGNYVVSLGKWLGSVAKVRVNGREVGHIASAPWECDVTEAVRAGRNTVEVAVIGTLKNTLGPHHASTPGNLLRGAAWPHMFQRGPDNGPPPGQAYDTIGYGLFEPFQLIQQTAH